MSLATNGLPSHLQTNGGDEIEYILTVTPKRTSSNSLRSSPTRPSARPPPSPTKSPSSPTKSPSSSTQPPTSPTKSPTSSTKSFSSATKSRVKLSPTICSSTPTQQRPASPTHRLAASSPTQQNPESPTRRPASSSSTRLSSPSAGSKPRMTPVFDDAAPELTPPRTAQKLPSPHLSNVEVRISNRESELETDSGSPHISPQQPQQLLTPPSVQEIRQQPDPQQQQQPVMPSPQQQIPPEAASSSSSVPIIVETVNGAVAAVDDRDGVESSATPALTGSFSRLKTDSIGEDAVSNDAADSLVSSGADFPPGVTQRPETPSSSSSSFQSVTPSGCATPLIGGGTPLGVAFGRQRTCSSDTGRRDDDDEDEDEDSESEEEEEEEEGTTSEEKRQVTMAQTDRFGFFVGSDQYSGNTSPGKKISIERMRRRERKWLDMTDNWERWMSKRFHKIKERCRKGIPPALRARAWAYLCGSKYMLEHHVGRYENLLSMDHDPRWVDDITKDLHRQFPLHEMFATQGGYGQKNLFNVLIAYATHNPEVGYCQAMAPLAAVLLMHMPEEQAFWSLVSICDRYMPGYYSAGLEQVQIDGDVLFGLLKKSSNVTYKHLKKQRVDPILIMMEWFMCVFSRTLPWPSVLRVWDMFFCEGIKVLFRVALVLFKSVLGTSAQCAECPGLYETVEALKNIPPEAQAEEFLAAESLKINVDEKDMEKEHKKQVKKRRKAKEAKEKELEMKKSGNEVKKAGKKSAKKKET